MTYPDTPWGTSRSAMTYPDTPWGTWEGCEACGNQQPGRTARPSATRSCSVETARRSRCSRCPARSRRASRWPWPDTPRSCEAGHPPRGTPSTRAVDKSLKLGTGSDLQHGQGERSLKLGTGSVYLRHGQEQHHCSYQFAFNMDRGKGHWSLVLGQSIFGMDRSSTTAATSSPSTWTEERSLGQSTFSMDRERSLKLGTGPVHLQYGQKVAPLELGTRLVHIQDGQERSLKLGTGPVHLQYGQGKGHWSWVLGQSTLNVHRGKVTETGYWASPP